jgi:hypothetical protein
MTIKLRPAPRCGGFLLLGLALLAGGCRETPSFTAPGGFYAAEAPPPGKALVHVYWPQEEKGRWQRVAVTSCCAITEELAIGSYLALAVEPGSSRLDIGKGWMLDDGAWIGTSELASLEVDAKAGSTHFVRLTQDPGLLTPHFTLRPVAPVAAGPEIRRCRKMVPLPVNEIVGQMTERVR